MSAKPDAGGLEAGLDATNEATIADMPATTPAPATEGELRFIRWLVRRRIREFRERAVERARDDAA